MPSSPQGSRNRRLLIVGVAGAALAAVVVVTGLVSRGRDYTAAKTLAVGEAVPDVSVVQPAPLQGAQPLVLPGNLQPFYNAQIYPRVSGYVRMWYRDIGARVKAGELLAVVDTPELDQQLSQARADLRSAQANMKLAATTAKRWRTLLGDDVVSQQETDEKAGDYEAKTALVDASAANLQRLEAMKAFARIVAPFDGVVTARRTDVGALVNAGASSASALFDVAEVDKLRLYVRVPQSYSNLIGPKTTATLSVPEFPGRTFNAAMTSTANAVSDNSGTLLVELAVDNHEGLLKTGDYAQVSFQLPQAPAAADLGQMQLPASALLFRNQGMEAAVVGPDGRVRLQPVTVLRDLGPAVQVSAKLSAQDHVIDNPPDSIASGQRVRVVQGEPAATQKAAHGPD
jgi:RND family efflux transporter MFP subunit